DRAAHLATVRRVAALGRRIVGAAQLGHLARGILYRLAAGDEIGVAQPHLATQRETEEILWRVLHEVIAFDIELATERQLPRPGSGVCRGGGRRGPPRSGFRGIPRSPASAAAAPPCADARRGSARRAPRARTCRHRPCCWRAPRRPPWQNCGSRPAGSPAAAA